MLCVIGCKLSVYRRDYRKASQWIREASHKARWCYSLLMIFGTRNSLLENKTCTIRHVTVRHASLLCASRLVQVLRTFLLRVSRVLS